MNKKKSKTSTYIKKIKSKEGNFICRNKAYNSVKGKAFQKESGIGENPPPLSTKPKLNKGK